MRKWIDLFEKAIVISVEDAEELVVHVNPTKSNLVAFINNLGEFPVVRGLIDNKTYFWSAYEAYHYDVAKELGILQSCVACVVATSLDKLEEEVGFRDDDDIVHVFCQSGPFFITVAEKNFNDPRFIKAFPDAQPINLPTNPHNA